MGANEGIHGVGIGLGHKPNPSAFVFNGTSGTAVVHHGPSDYANLLALRGHTVPMWLARYPPGPTPAYSTFIDGLTRDLRAGVISVTFKNVKVVKVAHIAGGVEVTLQYGEVVKKYPA